jgi:diguanylate cyclase (GGDEF)-like protein
MAAPILYQGKVLGVMAMGGDLELTQDLKALLSMISHMVALAFANSHQYRKIEQLANSDPLTKTFNKGYFVQVCQKAVEDARVSRGQLSILMFDLDSFKNYNDRNGHLAGDRLLTELAGILKREVRADDVVARFGGEEFIILLRETGLEQAFQTAERIRASVEDHPFEHRERQPLGFLSVSGGVAALPHHGLEMEELIEAADDALYEGKKAGRNRVVAASVHSGAPPASVRGLEEKQEIEG